MQNLIFGIVIGVLIIINVLLTLLVHSYEKVIQRNREAFKDYFIIRKQYEDLKDKEEYEGNELISYINVTDNFNAFMEFQNRIGEISDDIYLKFKSVEKKSMENQEYIYTDEEEEIDG